MTVTTDVLVPALEDTREAHAAVIDRFQSDLAVTPSGPHRTRAHSPQLSARSSLILCRSETHRGCSEWVGRAAPVCWNPVRVIVSLVFQVARKLLAVPVVLLSRDAAKDADLPVLRHENAVLRGQLTARYGTSRRIARGSRRCPR
jgi:hypothetical protein